MKQLLIGTSLLLTGVMLGWWLHGKSTTNPPLDVATVPQASLPARPVQTRQQAIDRENAEEIDKLPTLESARPPGSGKFRQLLNQQQFELALAYYEQALALDDRYKKLLKPVLEEYLQGCLQRCSDGIFVDLVDRWLQTYYQDTPVLLLLAEYQRVQGWPEEAASTLQLASTYSEQAGQRNSLNAAVQRLVTFTDRDLSQQQNWVALLGFYEYLRSIDLGTPEYLLRQASLYQAIDEPQSGRKLLLELQDSDNNLNKEWTAAISSALAETNARPTAEQQTVDGISVVRRGDHYLVSTRLNDVDEVTLMIDTGAT